MQFCPNRTNFSDIWVDHGINRCFYDTVTSALTFVVIVTWGIAQCARLTAGGKKVTEDEKEEGEGEVRFRQQAVGGSNLQLVLGVITFLLLGESLVHMILQDVFIQEDGLLGFNVFTMLLLTSGYLLFLLFLRCERNATAKSPVGVRCSGLYSAVVWGLCMLREACALISWRSWEWWWSLDTVMDGVELGFWAFRLTCCVFLFALSIYVKLKVTRRAPSARHLEEGVQLHVFPQEKKDKKEAKNKSTWVDIGKKIRIMTPIVWPSDSKPLQLLLLVCVLFLAGGRVVNVFVPIYHKRIGDLLLCVVNGLSGESPLEYPWQFIMVYCTLLYLKGAGSGGGLLQQLRQQLWIGIQQHSSLKMNIKVFRHVHSLSLHWHLQRKTGEVLRVVDQGTSSMNTVLNQAVFQILPTLVDSVIAVVYFVTVFNYLFGLIIFICIIVYIVLTLVMMEWRTKFRREMIRLDKEAKAKAVDSLLNFETVKYYGATEFEIQNYSSAIVGYQKAEWKSQTFLTLWQATQNTVTIIGYLAGLLLCAWAVVRSVSNVHLTVGDYVLLGSYLGQLFGPLNSLGGYYRILQRSFIDMENMFELLEMEEDVKDHPDAKELVITDGEIKFENVNFFYEPSRPILKDITFTVPPGQTVALVGHTGSGKSTIIRLLFRFYDIKSGAITIDGQDIAMVTQNSLRNRIGVVPQDTVLFNKDIQYNIQYGRFNANQTEVEEAATAAEIHDRILKFPSQYDTVVGERGLKLSGGEKQRVAIARTLLKAPAIILLDEATSALDTHTERNIQAALARVCQGRTTIVIAHRLSTVVHADNILVMNEGQIVERGTHEELLSKGSHYAGMWLQQLSGHNQDSNSSTSLDEMKRENGVS